MAKDGTSSRVLERLACAARSNGEALAYDAAHLFLTKAKQHVIREALPIPSLGTMVEVTVNGIVHRFPGTKHVRWFKKRRQEWQGPRGLLFRQRAKAHAGTVKARLLCPSRNVDSFQI